MKLLSCKYNSEGGLDIAFAELNPTTKKEEKHVLEDCAEEPTEAQAEAIQALSEIAIAICELPKKWALEIRGFALHYQKNEHAKVSISATRPLEIGGPLVLNSPRRNVTAEDEDAESVLTSKQAVLVDAATNAALAYLGGERAKPEPDMFADKGDEEDGD